LDVRGRTFKRCFACGSMVSVVHFSLCERKMNNKKWKSTALAQAKAAFA
jgi:DNA-directed RNA polymerase subunit N (RpoN/RPB10)